MVDQLRLIRELQSKVKNIESKIASLNVSNSQANKGNANIFEPDEFIFNCEDDSAANDIGDNLAVTVSGINSNGILKVKLAGKTVNDGEVFGITTRASASGFVGVKTGWITVGIYDAPGSGDTAFASLAFGDILKASTGNNGKLVVNNSNPGTAGKFISSFTLSAINYVILTLGSGGSGNAPDDLTIEVAKDANFPSAASTTTGKLQLFDADIASIYMVSQRKADAAGKKVFGFDWIRSA